jgi:TonB family protein
MGIPTTAQVTDVLAEPSFTPYTVKPDVKNRVEVVEALEAEYPPLLRDAGIGGMVLVWFFVDESGQVQKVQINESSGHQALDEAALRVGAKIEFTPALNKDKRVPVWISLPITFTTSAKGAAAAPEPGGVAEIVRDVADATERAAEDIGEAVLNTLDPDRKREDEVLTVTTAETPPKVREPGRNPESQADLGAAPTFTPYTVKPDVKNRREIQAALEKEYPPLLRDAGIGGRVMVWLFIDENGRVANTMINQTSGHLALDDAALRVAKIIEFTPALNRDERVPVWISLPITFMTR